MFKILPVVHCDMRFSSRKNKRISLFSERLWYCCIVIYLLVTTNTVITCIMALPDGGLHDRTKLSNFMKCTIFKS